MTSDYSNALSSSNDELCTADLTFNNNSSDSENSNQSKEIIHHLQNGTEDIQPELEINKFPIARSAENM